MFPKVPQCSKFTQSRKQNALGEDRVKIEGKELCIMKAKISLGIDRKS